MLNSRNSYSIYRWIISGSLFFIASALITWLIVQCGYGFDITDEGYYLNVIADPWLHRTSTSNFGLIYYPIFEVAGHSIPTLRALNLLVLYLLAVSLCYLVLIRRDRLGWLPRVECLALSMSFGASILVFYNLWLPTPNYNLLNIIGILLSNIALARVAMNPKGGHYVGALLLGLGGAICMLAKPSSAGLLSLVVIIYLSYVYTQSSGRFRVYFFVCISSFTAAAILAIAAYILDGSIVSFVSNLRDGVDAASSIIGKSWGMSSIFWRGNLALSQGLPNLIWLLMLVASYYIIYRYLRSIEALKYWWVLSLCIIWGLFVYLTGVLLNEWPNPMIGQTRKLLFLLCWPMLFFLMIVTLFRIALVGNARHNSVYIALMFLLLVMSYVIVLGTTNNYFTSISLLPFFGVCAVLVGLRSVDKSIDLIWLYPCAAIVIGFSALAVHQGIAEPYRQISWLNSSDTKVLDLDTMKGLQLEYSSAGYITALNDQAKSAGFVTGTPLIDFTGGSPGVAHILGALPLGAYWLLGGYEGSDSMASSNLKSHSAEVLNRAWVLIEPDGKRALSLDVLSTLNRNLERDYKLVATIPMPAKYGGRRYDRVQALYKPI